MMRDLLSPSHVVGVFRLTATVQLHLEADQPAEELR